jgi:hypothetical protein
MLGLNKRKFEALHRLLWRLASKPADTKLLVAFQRKLIRQIIQLEARINKSKRARSDANSALKVGGRSRVESDRLRRRVGQIDSRIDALTHLLFVWRCFGDGIAFLYLDKFALKQTFFETTSLRPKQSAGWISGKAGLANELGELEKASSLGLPALLTDLTNTIRHGDLCILTGPDPLLLESKTSDRLNARGKRQRAALEKLSTFYSTDVGKSLRGYEEVRRVQLHSEEVAYISELNFCIDLAEQANIGIVRPEAGLHYFAVYGGSPETMNTALEAVIRDATQVVYLNEYKSNGVWAPFYPFVLSIRRSKHLFDFVRGRMGLIVLFDNEEFDRRLAERGIVRDVDTKPPNDWGDEYVMLKNLKTGAQAGVSKQFLLRIVLEFTSPDWMADYFAQLLNRSEVSSVEEAASAPRTRSHTPAPRAPS